MKILFIARGTNRWKMDNPVMAINALAWGFEHHGAQVVRSGENLSYSELKNQAQNCDIVFFTKVARLEDYYFDLNRPTACFYGDWRPTSHRTHRYHSRADFFFCQSDHCKGIWMPSPVWTEAFAASHYRTRNNRWIFTGSQNKNPLLDWEIRKQDVQALPPNISDVFGKGQKKPHLEGKKYIEKLTQYTFGLSVSNKNDVSKYSSSRLAHYQSAGLTTAVRWFPGCEELVHPSLFVYKTLPELKEYVKKAQPIDEMKIRRFAQSTFDGRILARRILKEMES